VADPWDDPTVAVTHPLVPDYTDPGQLVQMDDLLFVDCTRCGPVTDYDDARPEARTRLQQLAKRHADEVHDGLVHAEGWAR
jgi:hypothetical protein